ncbi:MAG: hypothetical protein DWQ07_14740 [Chloroflexi bacterium]|nr:MAG: hypothetical protein DWQ07_14740 [Chloroflexota bacterium]MBL1195659.1 hypothetical protein [Chloroflexota bacterium]NOH12947.1 cyclic nucleotide-binding domain-containing protein [Chloroflexota bacterium]
MPEIAERSLLLRQISLFRHLSDEQIVEVAQHFDDFVLPQGQTLYEEGSEARNFYVIHQGAVRLWRYRNNREEEVAYLEEGDHFGEEELFFTTPRTATVTAARDATILFLDKDNFAWLVDRHPDIANDLQVFAQSYKQARQLQFDWLSSDEVIYLINIRHWFHLVRDLLVPLGIVLLSGIFWLMATFAPTQGVLAIGLVLGSAVLLIGIVAIIWQILDWRNDYFIITSQRVTWLERVILTSASRHEAPLAAIQSVNVRTSQVGRILRYGDVVVRTLTGSIVMTDVPNPTRMKTQIEQLMLRVRRKSEQAKEFAMRNALRDSLGLENGPTIEEEEEELHAPEIVIPEPTVERHSGLFRIFKVREVEGNTITYHRHWFVLFASLWLPVAFVVAIFVLSAYLVWTASAAGTFSLPSPLVILLFAITFILVPAGIIAYRYVDWRNDIYRVTADSVIDRDKKPLGTEVSKSAPLQNVLSLENRREGIIGILFNFGTVTINVGDTSLEFRTVHNPTQVQQDIFLRIEALKQAAKEAREGRDRERMVDAIRSYHELMNGGQPDPETDTESG